MSKILMDISIPKESADWYSTDDSWCVDWKGAHEFLSVFGIEHDDSDHDHHDPWFIDTMRMLPIGQRFIVEARTGLFWGTWAPRDWRTISTYVGCSEKEARQLYEHALDTLWPRVTGEKRPRKYPKRYGKDHIRSSVRYQVLERDGRRCKSCGRSPEDGVRLQVDHIIPVVDGGTGEIDNLQILCFDCNIGKGAR